MDDTNALFTLLLGIGGLILLIALFLVPIIMAAIASIFVAVGLWGL